MTTTVRTQASQQQFSQSVATALGLTAGSVTVSCRLGQTADARRRRGRHLAQDGGVCSGSTAIQMNVQVSQDPGSFKGDANVASTQQAISKLYPSSVCGFGQARTSTTVQVTQPLSKALTVQAQCAQLGQVVAGGTLGNCSTTSTPGASSPDGSSSGGSSDGGSGGLSTSAAVGIGVAVGGTALLALIAVVAFQVHKRKRENAYAVSACARHTAWSAQQFPLVHTAGATLCPAPRSPPPRYLLQEEGSKFQTPVQGVNYTQDTPQRVATAAAARRGLLSGPSSSHAHPAALPPSGPSAAARLPSAAAAPSMMRAPPSAPSGPIAASLPSGMPTEAPLIDAEGPAPGTGGLPIWDRTSAHTGAPHTLAPRPGSGRGFSGAGTGPGTAPAPQSHRIDDDSGSFFSATSEQGVPPGGRAGVPPPARQSNPFLGAGAGVAPQQQHAPHRSSPLAGGSTSGATPAQQLQV